MNCLCGGGSSSGSASSGAQRWRRSSSVAHISPRCDARLLSDALLARLRPRGDSDLCYDAGHRVNAFRLPLQCCLSLHNTTANTLVLRGGEQWASRCRALAPAATPYAGRARAPAPESTCAPQSSNAACGGRRTLTDDGHSRPACFTASLNARSSLPLVTWKPTA